MDLDEILKHTAVHNFHFHKQTAYTKPTTKPTTSLTMVNATLTKILI